MSELENGRVLVGATRQAVGELCRLLGHLSREGEGFSQKKLDEVQPFAFDLTVLAAELNAAESLLGTAQLQPHRARMAWALAAEVAQHARTLLAQQTGTPGQLGEEALGRLITEGLAVYPTLRDPAPGENDLEEEHRLIRDTFRAYAVREVMPLAEKVHREDQLVPEKWIRELAEQGCFGLAIPEAFGGFQEAPDNVGMVLVTEELSRGALVAGSLITRPEILSKALLKGGSLEQKKRWLPRIASGEKMVAVAVTEPDYGSDVAGLKVSAQPTEGGWLLNGVKTWCTFAGRAELLMVLARTDPQAKHKGLSLFIAEKPAFEGHEFHHEQPQGGRISSKAIPTLGYRGLHSFEVTFEAYFVPADQLIGEPGQGFYLQMEGFAGGRLQTAARALGVMQAAWEQAARYASERRVFGQPIGHYPLTAHKLGRMAAWIEATRLVTHQTARLMNHGGGQVEASLVKFLACRTAEWVTREAMQVHGGMGYAEEFSVSRLFVDARVLSIFEGAEEVLALRVIAPALAKAALAAQPA